MAEANLLRLASLPQHFKGMQGDDFITWSERFDAWCVANDVKIEEKVSIFPTLLGDPAFVIYRSIPSADQKDYEKIKKVFLEAFASDALLETFRAELVRRKRHVGENLAVYAAELKRLVSRAYPKYNEAAMKDVVLTHFMNGIESGVKVRNKEPKSIDEAVKIASKIECRSATQILSMQENLACMGGQKLESNSASQASNMQSLEQKVDTLTDQLQVMSAQLQQFSKQRSIVCYGCGAQGHFQKDCLVANRTYENRGKQRGYSGGRRAGGIRGRSRGMRGTYPSRGGGYGNPIKCYTCQGFGHLARDCPSDFSSLN